MSADKAENASNARLPVFPARSSRNLRYPWILGLILAAVTLYPGSHEANAATERGGLTEETFLGEVPIVLGATRLSQPVSESPASITVIDREMIEASGANELVDVLRLVPGFQVGHINGYRAAVTYHGLSDSFARRLQVLVDGRSVYTPLFGGVQWAELPLALEDIDKIEVIRGPNGVTYGANAFSAVINIVTRHPSQDIGTFTKFTKGEIDYGKALVRQGGTSGKLTYRFTLSYQEDDGFRNLNDSKVVRLATFRGDYRATQRDMLDFQVGFNGGPRADGTEGDIGDPARFTQADNHFQQVRWRHTVDADEDYSLTFYHNHYRTTDTYSVPLLMPLIEDHGSERYDVEFQHTLSPRNTWRVVWGAEARLDRARGEGWFNTPNYIDTRLYRLFSNVEWHPAPDWILNAGAMYEHNGITGGDISPRIALNHHLTPQHTIRASVSQAFRTPSVFEYRADTLIRLLDGTPIDQLYKSTVDLLPEKITSYELGYIGEFFTKKLMLDAKIYHEEIRRIITVPIVPYVDLADGLAATFVNDGRADINGAEIQLNWRPTAKTRIVFAQAYAHQRGQMLKQTTPTVAYLDTLRSTPVQTKSLLARHEFPGRIAGSLAYYKVSNVKFLGEGDETGGYTKLDLRIAYKTRLGGTRSEISFVGQNLKDKFFDLERQAIFDKRFFLNVNLELK